MPNLNPVKQTFMNYNIINILKFSCLLVVLFLSACRLDDTTLDPVEPLPYGNLEDFFSKQVDIQSFSLEANQDNTITAANGTEINIPANSFADASGNAVTGTVNLNLKELLSKANMVLSNKPTMSNGELLVSTGALFLNPTQDDQNLAFSNLVETIIPKTLDFDPFEGFHLLTSGSNSNLGTALNWSIGDQNSFEEMNEGFNITSNKVNWMSIGKLYDSNTSTISVNPVGYGIYVDDQTAFLVYKNINAVQQAKAVVGAPIIFENVPENQDAILFVLGMDPHNFFVGVQNLTTSSNELNINLNVAITPEEEMINTVNGFN